MNNATVPIVEASVCYEKGKRAFLRSNRLQECIDSCTAMPHPRCSEHNNDRLLETKLVQLSLRDTTGEILLKSYLYFCIFIFDYKFHKTYFIVVERNNTIM